MSFVSHDILAAIPWVLWLFCLSYFLFIELKHILKTYQYGAIFVWAAAIWSFIVWFDIVFQIIAVLLFHLALWYFVYSIGNEMFERKSIRLRSLIHSGAYMFTALMTISYSILSLGVFKEFTLTCDELYSYSDDVLTYISSPFALGIDQITTIQKNIQELWSLSLQEFIGAKNQIYTWETIETLTETWADNKEFIWLLGTVDMYSQRFLSQIMNDNSTINKWLCDYLIDEIAQRFNKPVFQFSAILLMFILLSPLIRILVLLIEIIIFIILKLCFVLWMYTYTKQLEEVEDIM